MEDEIKERNSIHGRFKGASWYPYPQSIIVGGAGGIGSWLTLFLARQGHDIHLFDDDVISVENIGGQLYGITATGEKKVEELRDTCSHLADHEISTYDEKFTSESAASPVMFSCFDNMKARMDMFLKWAPGRLFIDGRLNAETAEMFCVYDERTAKLWKESWFSDEMVPDAPCTFKATSHCAAILAGLMVAALNNYTANMHAGEERDVPFKTSIWLPTMQIVTEQ